MKKLKLISGILSVVLLSSTMIMPLNIHADSSRVVTLGADLSETQKETVLNFFNVSEDEVIIISVNNQEEREYLEGIVSNDIIGTRTLSCCYINPTNEGGIQVKTANLTWVTENMLANALATAGVENCQVIATAPFQVSGTGALTGILKSYETASEETLDEDKKEAATEELVISAELTDVNEEDDVLKFMNDIKSEAISNDVSEDKINDLITEKSEEHNVTISDEQLSKLNEWLKTLQSLNYNIESFTNAINNLNDTIKSKAEGVEVNTQEAKGFFARIWEAICSFFKSLFGKGEEVVQNAKDNIPSIFDEVNTDIFEFDENTLGDSENSTETEITE
ncbi:MAG: DUF1002 domain-containing protein [Oscillospiraceae bacterium]